MTSADGPSCQLLDIFVHPIRYGGLQSGVIFGGGDEEDGDVEEINGEGEFVLEVGLTCTVPIHLSLQVKVSYECRKSKGCLKATKKSVLTCTVEAMGGIFIGVIVEFLFPCWKSIRIIQ
jgi:hypothetical protein